MNPFLTSFNRLILMIMAVTWIGLFTPQKSIAQLKGSNPEGKTTPTARPAPGAPPGIPGHPVQTPIDGGLGLLVVAGGAYALKRLRPHVDRNDHTLL